MSTNYDYLRNEELRRQFYYGSVFKDNIDKDSILESIELGLSDYINKISQPLIQLTNTEISNLEEWKRAILHRTDVRKIFSLTNISLNPTLKEE